MRSFPTRAAPQRSPAALPTHRPAGRPQRSEDRPGSRRREAGLLQHPAYAEAPLDAATPAFLDNEFGARDVNRFASLATSRRHVAWLDDATGNDRFASPRSRDIMRPLGLGDELRAALVVDERCWGYLCLHRADGRLGFTREEAATVARLGPHLAAALRQALLLRAPTTGNPAAPGVVLLADDLSVIAVTAQAEYLLSLVDNPAPLPLPLPVAVVVERAQAQATAPVLLSAHGLTAREADIARLVLRGLSTTAIADSLHISANTVQDHLKAVSSDKTGVHSRRDLVARFLAATKPSP